MESEVSKQMNVTAWLLGPKSGLPLFPPFVLRSLVPTRQVKLENLTEWDSLCHRKLLFQRNLAETRNPLGQEKLTQLGFCCRGTHTRTSMGITAMFPGWCRGWTVWVCTSESVPSYKLLLSLARSKGCHWIQPTD